MSTSLNPINTEYAGKLQEIGASGTTSLHMLPIKSIFIFWKEKAGR